MGGRPDQLVEPVARLRSLAEASGRPVPEVIVMTGLPLDDPPRAAARAAEYRDAGVTRLAFGSRYPDADTFRREVDALAAALEALRD